MLLGGKIECQQNHSPRKQRFTVPSKASRKRRCNVSPEARTSEILFKPTEEPNQRLTSGLSPVYQRLISGTRSALCSWLPASGTTLFRLCKPFSCRACSGIYYTYYIDVLPYSVVPPSACAIFQAATPNLRVKTLEQDTAYYRIRPNARYGPA